jgi:Domain of unknown function (DUF4384)
MTWQPRTMWTGALLILAMVTTAAIARGNQEARAAPPATEKRSCIQIVDGYSYIAEDKTVADLRTTALNNAKQQALANARTYIRSRTEVENFILKSDEVLIGAEGTVTILEREDFGIVDNSRYHIRIKAEVEYFITDGNRPEPSTVTGQSAAMQPAVAPTLPGSAAPLTVKVWSSKNSYRNGEKIEIFVQGNRDFYARVVNINERGEIVQLLPNDFRDNFHFQGGKRYRIPDQGDGFELTVSPPYGRDRIVVYASEVPLGQVAMQGIGQGLKAYGGDQKSLALATRGIAVTAKKTPEAAPAVVEFYEASHQIETSP